jgi:glycerol kinase
MRNPFDLTELDNAVEEQQSHVDISAYQSHDGNRSLLQNENRRDDNLKDRFIGAIDQGTTSSRFIIFDCTGVPVAKYQTEFRQIHEHSG